MANDAEVNSKKLRGYWEFEGALPLVSKIIKDGDQGAGQGKHHAIHP